MSDHEIVEEDPSSSTESPFGAHVDVDSDVGEAEAAVDADLAALSAERDEMRALAQRLQADFENYKKRMLREQTTAIEHANVRLLESLLPVLESFELAAKSIENPEADIDKLRGGMLAAIRQLDGALTKEGLEPIGTVGQPFDPQEHEAVAQDDGDGEPVVGDVLRTGYRFKGRTLRPAMVRVTRTEP